VTDKNVEDFDDLDAAYAEIRKEPYAFTLGGRRWLLPHMADLDYRMLIRIEKHESLDADALAGLFTDLFGADQRQAWTDTQVPLPQLYLLWERYMKHCGVHPGEEPASSGSSGSTGTSSRRTSGTSTASVSPKRSTARKAASKRAPRKAAAKPGTDPAVSRPESSSA
jgi:hypothetical protein